MFANLVVAIRQRGFHSYQVARAVGVSEARFSRCVHGRGEFQADERSRIAEFLRANPEWLFCERISIPPLPEVAVAAAASVGARGG